MDDYYTPNIDNLSGTQFCFDIDIANLIGTKTVFLLKGLKL
jgi:hypothetical protein